MRHKTPDMNDVCISKKQNPDVIAKDKFKSSNNNIQTRDRM